MRCLRIGSARSSTSSIEGARRPSSSARARTASISDWLARGPGPQAISLSASPPSGLGTRGAHQRQDRLDDAVADRQAAHQPLRRDQDVRVHRRLGQRLFRAGGFKQDAAFGVAIGIVDVDLHQEAVELRFGQRIGAFLLQRVLRGEHMERLGQIMPRACNRDVLFLHGLQQRRLGARAGAVDFVGHQELREYRPGDEAERALAGIALVQHLGAQNIRRHQVRRELDALGVQPERNAQGFDQLGLGEAGHADQKRVAAGQDRYQGVFDHPVLAEDDGWRSLPWRRGSDRRPARPSGQSRPRVFRHRLRQPSNHFSLRPALLARLACDATDGVVTPASLMLNLCKGHVFVELNYPHIIGVSGY